MAVSNGDRVKVHYEGRVEDGEVFDKSEEKPLEFTVGSGEIIPGFENAVLGMEEGQDKEVKIESQDAYGEKREDLVFEVSKEKLPDNIEPKVGMSLQTKDPNSGRAQIVRVAGVKDESIIIDANHPLAGHTLVFNIKLVGINN